jgi:hypothetical protein
MTKTAAAGRGRWILLLPSLPPGATSVRVRVWRRLGSVGATSLKNAVWVLPQSEESLETFQWLAREIEQLGGQASVCEGQFVAGVSDEEMKLRFVQARNADFAELAAKARVVARSARSRPISRDKRAALASRHEKLVRRMDEIDAIDFFGAERSDAAKAIEAIARALVPVDRSERTLAALAPMARPRRATWVTRTGVHVDRIACSWLIRRFIDPDARLEFVPAKGFVPEAGKLRFDMYDAEFTHVGDRSSFEVLLERMGFRDPALTAIGEIVHDIDLKDAKFDRRETAGVVGIITGICTMTRDDLARIAAATPLFDALYAFFQRGERATRRLP